MRAMMGVIRLLSSICRQFLLGLARLDRKGRRARASPPYKKDWNQHWLQKRCRYAGPIRPTHPGDEPRRIEGVWTLRRRKATKPFRNVRIAESVLWQPGSASSRAKDAIHFRFPAHVAVHNRYFVEPSAIFTPQSQASRCDAASAVMWKRGLSAKEPAAFADCGRLHKAAPWRQIRRAERLEKEVVPGGGFEPPTRGFSVRCSTN